VSKIPLVSYGKAFDICSPNNTIKNMTGQIKVNTENLLPIIKKFLYSDHEIFLRELVSNGVDATKKLKAFATMSDFSSEIGDMGNLTIEIKINKEAKTISIIDRGIGMTQEEVEKYITQIAFSGAEEFVEKYKDKVEPTSMIGHFGLGFYSSFMVAQKVEIQTLSFKNDAAPVRWESDGSTTYTIEEGSRKERGTEIILHIDEEHNEYLEDFKIEELLKKYCKFLPIEIKFGTNTNKVKEEGSEVEKEVVSDNIINNPVPAWIKKPAELKEEDYKSFYRELYPNSFDEPLFNIHLNVDYPFNLTGILYFPRVNNRFEPPKEKIQLYCNQVFVTDNVENIVPDFLTMLRGVIDSPDIPLNVSRSYLQADNNVKKISGHITKKVADKLEELYKKDKEDFSKKWDDIKLFVQYGMISDEKFYEKAEKFALFTNVDGKSEGIKDYIEQIRPLQTDKEGNVIILYATNKDEQYAYISTANDRGYDVLLMNTPLDAHYINHLESKLEKVRFTRVDSDTVEKLIKKDGELPSKLTEEDKKKLQPIFEGFVDKMQYSVAFEDLSETDLPVTITRPEFMRRMKDMSAMGGGSMGFYGNMPEMMNLVVNANHPLVDKVLKDVNEDSQKMVVKQAIDLALLSQGLLKGEALSTFIKRSVALI
jgi:molecular chaperone HtpG